MTTGKTTALTRQTFVGKEMSLLLNMLSRLVIAFLPSSKRLLISWLQSLSAVIWEPKKIKSLTVSVVSPSICHKVIGPDAMNLVFWMSTFSFLNVWYISTRMKCHYTSARMAYIKNITHTNGGIKLAEYEIWSSLPHHEHTKTTTTYGTILTENYLKTGRGFLYNQGYKEDTHEVG